MIGRGGIMICSGQLQRQVTSISTERSGPRPTTKTESSELGPCRQAYPIWKVTSICVDVLRVRAHVACTRFHRSYHPENVKSPSTWLMVSLRISSTELLVFMLALQSKTPVEYWQLAKLPILPSMSWSTASLDFNGHQCGDVQSA